jgi:hypothetical protein
MAKKLDYQKRLQIFYMPYKRKLIELFKNFPSDNSYVKELSEALLSERKIGTNIVQVRGKISYVELQVFKFASIRKVCAECSIDDFFITFFDYSTEKEIISENFPGEKINALCGYILPFILTCGKDKKYIPLLINDFPSFARYALAYTPPPIELNNF